ncbi:conserved hypothetical protein [Candidatus Desulforudis audaxviator MP104C]|uniref:DUF2149 domain-containing protein n=1 Tax=Desulforudis audaxviator (strain MP104C) TaxID=477974 RepID=B1I2L4_DESAP|nr:DUF2149 domain-containing protein [Candidatus Desulforudis audaxviator]ACA59254.1 conserved hypothetical protein [Candidatus Desulforudis audaxviator MP104C]
MLRQQRLRQRLSRAEENDPMAGLANMLDVMLVFCCGLLVILVLSWNLQSVFFSELTPEEKQRLLQTIQKVIQVEQARELEEIPEIQATGGGGSGYREMGKVYQDPETGKLIMIQTE